MIQPGQANGAVLGQGGGLSLKGLRGQEKLACPAGTRSGRPPGEGLDLTAGGGVCQAGGMR